MLAHNSHVINKKPVSVKALEPVPLSNNSLLIRNVPENMTDELLESVLESRLGLEADSDFTVDFRPPYAVVQFNCDYSDRGTCIVS